MNAESQETTTRAVALRHRFDRTFATPPPQSGIELHRFLALRIGEKPFAIRVGEIGELVSDRKIVHVPGGPPELAGLAGVGGRVVAVYDLGRLLGQSCASGPGRWLALCRPDGTLGLRFTDFEGYLEVGADDVHTAAPDVQGVEHLSQLLRVDKILRRIVDVVSIQTALEKRVGSAATPSEK